ncbi:DUF3297 family protein [Sphingomonas sp.]|jgi:hypothetical protein|uniref:DUF3297 family protein n=1 Tax=Sphingomonas sp. TaxID=28214 RepID=UPI00325FA26F
MSDTPVFPDRLSLDPRSPHYDGDLLQKGVRINFNGSEKTNVEEYCLSEGWIKVAAGRSRDRNGNPMTLKLKGTVEPFFDDASGVEAPVTDPASDS